MPRFCLVGCVLNLISITSFAQAEGVSQDLFNGRDLSGWHVTNCMVAVEKGSLVLQEGNGLVRSDHRYANFTLELDWRARKEKEYDSGIYFRADLPMGARPWPARYQVNLLQGLEGNVTTIPEAKSTGLIKAGQWNHFKLTVVGSQAAMEINGQHAWQVNNIEPAHGYIGFQAEVAKGGQFEFRNIRITEHGYRSLFNGQDFAQWEGATANAAACWKVEDGLLLCTGQKGPWLRSKEQVEDFNLRLEYKLKAGGNSGVYVRVPKDGAHRGSDKGTSVPSGVEVQILDDADERYKTLQAYQYSGSVYAIAPARERVSKPAGEWNTLEINCAGPSYRITHNGVVVVDATAEQFPELATRLQKGYLGLQNHSEEVWFRNVRLGPALK